MRGQPLGAVASHERPSGRAARSVPVERMGLGAGMGERR
jgi:hypothetical protein